MPESCPEALASRKVADREVYTEGSETAKPGSNEQELDTEANQIGWGTTCCQRPKNTKGLISRSSGYWVKEYALTWGGLELYELQIEKSAEVIVVDRIWADTERIKSEFSRVDEGLNVE